MSEGWYIESLLRDRELIIARANNVSAYITDPIYEVELDIIAESDEASYIPDFEDDDDFDNLLTIEAKLKELLENKQLSSKEAIIINNLLNNKSFTQTGRELKMSRMTISKIFSNVCNRVAFLLGREFTNEGYLDYMREKYCLTDQQISKARIHINSNQKYNKRSRLH
jgi:hypothetical protein